jgi:hypothetical protein
MMNVRSGARFAQETRPRARILRHASVNDLQRSSRVQHGIASAIRDRHRSCAQLNGETICAYFHFEVGVS